MNKIGSHVSFSSPNYLVGAVEEQLEYGGNSLMMYLGAPQNTRRVDFEKMRLDEYEKNYATKIPKENILVHAPYIINPSSVEKHGFAIEFLINEISTMNKLGLKQIVLHPGAHTKWTREEGIETLIKSLKEIFSKTKDVEILLETMAGKGTEIGTTFEELVKIIKAVDNPRLGVCADTCHMWEAGYDINDTEVFLSTLKETGIDKYIRAWHINNSKNPISAHKDRHEQLAKGVMNPETLKKIVNHKPFNNMIKVLETPWEDGKPAYKEEIAYLTSK